MSNTTYPSTPQLGAGQTISTQWLMNNPVVLYRVLRTLVMQRLIGGFLLAGRVDLTGSGSGIFGVSESIFPNRQAKVVAPGGEYPLTDTDDGLAAQAIISKLGLGTEFPQELVAHRRDDVTAKKLRKIVNQILFQFDGTVLSAITSAVTQTQGATAAWNAAGADQLLDTLLAGAQVDSLNQGYEVDTIVARPIPWARLVAATKVIQGLPRESPDNVVLKGRVVEFAGLNIVKTTNMLPGVDVMVLDSAQLGSIAYERLGGEGWTGDPMDVETKVIPMQRADGWEVYARKLAVPMVQEPGAAVKITGV